MHHVPLRCEQEKLAQYGEPTLLTADLAIDSTGLIEEARRLQPNTLKLSLFLRQHCLKRYP